MAIYPNYPDVANYNGAVGKTHTGLVVSEGAAPAEQFIVSKTNTSEPFIYEYGPEGNQTVLLAKGKIVEATGEEMNRETGFVETALRVAEEGSIRTVGVNHHNVYDQKRGSMSGNRPTILTRSYIEVPLFEHSDESTAATTAKAMHFGAAYGVTEALKSGDFVMAGKDGNFKKYDGTDFQKVIGQVLGVSRQLPPSGLLQYYTGLESSELDSYLKAISAAPGALDSNHPYGSPYSVGSWKKEFLKTIGGGNLTGIPFLTDGYFSAKQNIEVTLTDKDKVEAVRPGDGVNITGKNVTVDAGITESMFVVKLKHKLDKRALENISAKYGAESDSVISKRDLHVDVVNNSIVIYVEGGQSLENLTITVPSVVNPIAGIPTEWDYQGSVGAARILLMR